MPSSFAAEEITLSTYYPAPYGEFNSLAVGSGYSAPSTNGCLVVENSIGVKTEDTGMATIAAGGSSLTNLGAGDIPAVYAQDINNQAIGTLGHNANSWGSAGVYGCSWSPTAVGVFGSIKDIPSIIDGSSVRGLCAGKSLGDLGFKSGGIYAAVRGQAYNAPDQYSGYFKDGPVHLDNSFLGIGQLTPAHPIHLASGAHCTVAGTWTNASDIAFKENIVDLGYGINEVMMFKPRAFDMKIDGSHQIGFVAQEIEDIVPEVVSGEEGQKGISYGTITAVLVKAIQEQQAVINRLALDIEELKKNQNK